MTDQAEWIALSALALTLCISLWALLCVADYVLGAA